MAAGEALGLVVVAATTRVVRTKIRNPPAQWSCLIPLQMLRPPNLHHHTVSYSPIRRSRMVVSVSTRQRQQRVGRIDQFASNPKEPCNAPEVILTRLTNQRPRAE
jgi:hypothetical protein